MNLIVSADKNWGIGKNGELLFYIERDMELFKKLTLGNAVIMGRKTLDSLPEGKPLKNRANIVLTRSREFKRGGVTVCFSVDEVLKEAEKYGEAFVIGGAEIYRLFLPYCGRAYVTRVFAEREADSFMVNLDDAADWNIISETTDFSDGGLSYKFAVYEKTGQKNGAFL